MMASAAVMTLIALYRQDPIIVILFIILPLGLSLWQYRHWYDSLTMIAHVTGALSFF
jgi:hypothetical protein